jgi:hypothetical protein
MSRRKGECRDIRDEFATPGCAAGDEEISTTGGTAIAVHIICYDIRICGCISPEMPARTAPAEGEVSDETLHPVRMWEIVGGEDGMPMASSKTLALRVSLSRSRWGQLGDRVAGRVHADEMSTC